MASQHPLDPQWFPVVRLSFQSLQLAWHDEAANRVEGLEWLDSIGQSNIHFTELVITC